MFCKKFTANVWEIIMIKYKNITYVNTKVIISSNTNIVNQLYCIAIT